MFVTLDKCYTLFDLLLASFIVPFFSGVILQRTVNPLRSVFVFKESRFLLAIPRFTFRAVFAINSLCGNRNMLGKMIIIDKLFLFFIEWIIIDVPPDIFTTVAKNDFGNTGRKSPFHCLYFLL